jgi:hypothetical protein
MTVIFAQPWGGLGDNLQFTTLPRLYHERGEEFYISSHNQYRNEEIYEFCWKNNPYVKGIINQYPTIGASAPDVQKGVTDNIVSAAEIRHGFSGSGRYPEIYYEPNVIDEMADKILVDLSAHTLINNGLDKFYNVETLFDLVDTSVPRENVRFVTFKNVDIPYLSGGFDFEEQEIQIESIFHYADLIHSSKEYYCLYSGGNSMAAAIKNKCNSNVKINCFLHGTVNENLDKAFFIFDNVNYIEVV